MAKCSALGAKQQEILSVIQASMKRRGYPPSVREIGKLVGLKSPSTVHSHLNKLEELGFIRRESDKNRAIDVVGESDLRNIPMISVPLVGRVTAGQPVLAVENIEETYPLPAALVGHDNVFMLKVDGESMVQAGILDGDYVIVRDQDSAHNGDIIVALLDGEEATLKRYFHEKKRVRLQPENDSMKPIYTTDVAVLGKVVGVYRKM